MDIHIDIKELMVNDVSASSGIFSGENYHTGWSAVSKVNTGLNLGGDSNCSKDCVNMVYDPDGSGIGNEAGEFRRTAKKQMRDQ